MSVCFLSSLLLLLAAACSGSAAGAAPRPERTGAPAGDRLERHVGVLEAPRTGLWR